MTGIDNSAHKRYGGYRRLALVSLVLAGALMGIIIASGIDLSPQLTAQVGTNVAETGRFPVVDNNGVPESPFVSIVDQVQDAVVNISARSHQDDVDWWHRRAGLATSSGSGFFFREDGFILTNNHVVQGAEKLTVRTATGFEYDARLVGGDSKTDLAVLKVEPEEKVTVIPFGDSDALKVGDWAIAIGNPFPQQGLDRTVTVGVISAKGRSQLNFGEDSPDYQYYIQTDASINPGNSGGPLLNLRGEVIGVNAAISSPIGASVGIGFAIPINLARAIVPDLIATGRVSRGWLGVYLANVTEREAKRQGLESVNGVIIDDVFENSPAERAGIRKGDVIIGFNDQPVVNAGQFSVLVSTVRDGQNVPIELVRDGVVQKVSAVIGDRDAFLAASGVEGGEADDFEVYEWMGMEVMTYTPEIARAISAKHVAGVYVRQVYPGSVGDRSSIVRGTVILQIDDETTKTIEDVIKVENRLRDSSERIPVIVQEPDGAISRKVLRP